MVFSPQSHDKFCTPPPFTKAFLRALFQMDMQDKSKAFKEALQLARQFEVEAQHSQWGVLSPSHSITPLPSLSCCTATLDNPAATLMELYLEVSGCQRLKRLSVMARSKHRVFSPDGLTNSRQAVLLGLGSSYPPAPLSWGSH